MKNRIKIVKVKDANGTWFRAYDIDTLGQESLIKVFSYKEEADPNDKYWGEETAKQEALDFAKRWEKFMNGNEEEIIYQTPE